MRVGLITFNNQVHAPTTTWGGPGWGEEAGAPEGNSVHQF